MEETGVVAELQGGMALVKMNESGGCEGCNAAGTCKAAQGGGRMLMAENRIGAKVGQCVTVKVEGGAFLAASFLVYIVPVIFLFVGAWAGGALSTSVLPGVRADYMQAAGGVALLALSIIVIRYLDKKAGSAKGLRPVIVKIS